MIRPDLFSDALITLRRNKTRSLLAGLAVASGVFILLVALAGFNVFESGSFGELSRSKKEFVLVSPNPTTKSYAGFGAGRTWVLEHSDLNKLLNDFPNDITDAAPAYVFPGEHLILTENGKTDYARVMATHPCIFEPVTLSTVYGRFIDKMDMQKRRKVCTIGIDLSERWFGKGEDPCGRDIQVENILYTIVGVIRKGNPMILPFGNESQAVLIPYTTSDIVYGLDGKVTHLTFSLDADEESDKKAEQIISHLRLLHKVDPNDTDATRIIMLQEYSRILKALFSGTKILFWVVFFGIIISSILGVLGIMLLSVRERRNEIAVRLSIGALPREIKMQFIQESIVLSCFFSLTGLAAAEIVLFLARLLYRQGVINSALFGLPTLSFGGVMAVLLVVATGGVLAGYLPSRRMAESNVAELLNDIR